MPHSKNADIRYHILNNCFRSIKRYFMKDLIYKCGVSKSQIHNDIIYMKEHYGAPIIRQKDGHRTYYEYADKQFSIDKRPISERELHQIRELLLMLSRFNDLPQFNLVETLITNIENEYGDLDTEFEKSEQIISLDNNVEARGGERIPTIYEAIVDKIPLRIEYQTFHKGERVWIIHPYFMKQYNNRWYLIGLSDDEYHNIAHIGLDRISDITPANVPFIKNTVIDNIDEYFWDVVGVSIPPEKSVERILLKFSNHRFPYVEAKPIHGSQRIIDRENCVIALDLKVNRELESIILSLGEDVEVLEPLWFRDNIADVIKNSYMKYFTVQ